MAKRTRKNVKVTEKVIAKDGAKAVVEEIIEDIVEEIIDDDDEAETSSAEGVATSETADEIVVGEAPGFAAAATYVAIGQSLALSAQSAAEMQQSSSTILHSSTVDAVSRILFSADMKNRERTSKR